jgi:tetratricopeptide (TPR) repeat protein
MRHARWLTSILLALSLSACATTASRPPAPEHPMLVRAEQALLAGDDEQALQCYRAYRTGFADGDLVSECYAWEGTIHLKKGRLAEAEAAFKGALGDARSRFVEAQAHVGLGDCRFARDDYAGAIQSYQRALDLRVPDARNDYALYRCGVARQRLGEWEAGKACYQLVVRDHRKSPLAGRAEQRLRYPDRYLHLQVGAFQAEDGAKALEESLHRRGLVAKTVNVVNGPAPYLVWVGDYTSFGAAQSAMAQVKSAAGTEEVVLVP